MARPKPQIPATVRRLETPYRWLERFGAVAVLAVMAGLFLTVRAAPAPAATQGFASTDFRMEAPAEATSARNGRITANVATADALEVLGASPIDASAAAAALREAAPTRGARLHVGTAAGIETLDQGAVTGDAGHEPTEAQIQRKYALYTEGDAAMAAWAGRVRGDPPQALAGLP